MYNNKMRFWDQRNILLVFIHNEKSIQAIATANRNSFTSADGKEKKWYTNVLSVLLIYIITALYNIHMPKDAKRIVQICSLHKFWLIWLSHFGQYSKTLLSKIYTDSIRDHFDIDYLSNTFGISAHSPSHRCLDGSNLSSLYIFFFFISHLCTFHTFLPRFYYFVLQGVSIYHNRHFASSYFFYNFSLILYENYSNCSSKFIFLIPE